MLPNVQVDGTLNVEAGGEIFIPAGANFGDLESQIASKVSLNEDETIAGIKTFSSSPIVPTPTTGTQAVNKDYADLKVALTEFTGTNQSLSSSGYQKLPGGLIIQWGFATPGTLATQRTITLPISYSNLHFVALAIGKLGNYVDPITVGSYTLSTFSVKTMGSPYTDGFYWISLGY